MSIWPADTDPDDWETALTGTTWLVPERVFLPHHVTGDDVAEVDRYSYSVNDVGTELKLVALLRLKDGRYATVIAWNDYTGWDCQDGADVRIAETRDAAICHGLGNDERSMLDLTCPQTVWVEEIDQETFRLHGVLVEP
jgi:hypothetical protein